MYKTSSAQLGLAQRSSAFIMYLVWLRLAQKFSFYLVLRLFRLGFDISILIRRWSLVFDTPMIQILALYLYFNGANNILVIQVLIWGFGGHWMQLTQVWHLYPDLDMDPMVFDTPMFQILALS